jgi:lysophospholipase L1-like esterase
LVLVVGLARAEHVVILGSSTAEGVGASHPDSSWVGRYRAYRAAIASDDRVTNLARGGYTIFHIRPDGLEAPVGRPEPDPERNVSMVLRLEPDTIIINLPSNDAAYGHAVDEQLDAYDEVLAAADTESIAVWIATTQPRNLTTDGRQNLVAMRDSLVVRYGEHVIDFWTDLASPDGTIAPPYDSGDGIHLNDRGHALLCRRVIAALSGMHEGHPR